MKHGNIMSYFLESVVEEHQILRGSFRFHEGTTEEGVSKAKEKFLYELRKWKQRKQNKDKTLEIHAVAHCTSPTSLHYDFVAYCSHDLSVSSLVTDIRNLWSKSGGESTTLIAQEPARISGQSRYIFKSIGPRRFRRKRIYLLRRKGLRLQWQTKNFFQGNTIENMWREVRISWFGEESVLEWERQKENKRDSKQSKHEICQTRELPNCSSASLNVIEENNVAGRSFRFHIKSEFDRLSGSCSVRGANTTGLLLVDWNRLDLRRIGLLAKPPPTDNNEGFQWGGGRIGHCKFRGY